VQDPYLEYLLELLASEGPTDRPHLISVHELRAAGALYVPPSWRKSLGGEEQRDLFSNLTDDDDQPIEEQEPEPTESDGDESEDEPQ